MGAYLVYLAGKISDADWRNRIVRELRGHIIDVHTIYSSDPAETYIDELFVSGPFFISCDHGCYHGHKTHGVGAYSPGDFIDDEYPGRCSGIGVPKSLVPSVCMSQINCSDFVFAYIDSPTCYGTLAEIGFAIGRKLPVAVMFANSAIKDDMWFIAESADIVFNKHGYVKKAETKNVKIFDLAQQIAALLASGGGN